MMNDFEVEIPDIEDGSPGLFYGDLWDGIRQRCLLLSVEANHLSR